MNKPKREKQANAKTPSVGDVDIAMLYRMTRGQMMSVARRIVGTDVDAEDVVQQAFLNGLAHAASFEGRAQPSTWMYRVTTNTALMHLRTRRRKGADSLDAMPVEVAAERVADAAPRPVPRPDDEVVRRFDREHLKDALDELPMLDRRIVELRLSDGYSTEEVASETGLSTGAIKSRLFRARRALQDRLAEQDVSLAPAT